MSLRIFTHVRFLKDIYPHKIVHQDSTARFFLERRDAETTRKIITRKSSKFS
jgi:hypothetical protein